MQDLLMGHNLNPENKWSKWFTDCKEKHFMWNSENKSDEKMYKNVNMSVTLGNAPLYWANVG